MKIFWKETLRFTLALTENHCRKTFMYDQKLIRSMTNQKKWFDHICIYSQSLLSFQDYEKGIFIANKIDMNIFLI